MKRKALGKGIRAIIPESTQQALAAEARSIRISDVRPNPFQPRDKVEEGIEELAASVKLNGVLQPVMVRRRRDGYELIMGERRFRAARQAGLDTIPALVRDATDEEMLELALVENLQRENLNPIEEATAYRQLTDKFGLTHDEIAARVGKDRSTVSNALRLLGLPFKVRDALAARRLSAGHGRALLALHSRRDQVSLAERAVRQDLSVRALERLCASLSDRRKRRPEEKDVHIRELEQQLQEMLGTRVQITESRNGKGRITISYFSAEDLDRLLRVIRGT
ncbi:MAG: ParB/RepB/Spo0J family partition protein [candidate division WOR-3 bacterium]|nr:MAG: ParB/RepB/Spo0J family partition protein [candidate division WOR-3 bacterium]